MAESVSNHHDPLHLFRRLGRHTRFVNISKIALILTTLGLLGIAIIWPLMETDQAGVRINMITVTDEKDQEMPVMKNPRFQGTDNKNQPYLVTADKAVQQDKDHVRLLKVSADMSFEDSSWMLVSANEGILTLSEKDLLLLGKVELFHDGGYEMQTERIRVDIAGGHAYGDHPLRGRGPMGLIEARQFEIFDRGERLVFHGPVRVVIQQERNR